MTSRTGKMLCLLAVALPGLGWCAGEWCAARADAAIRHRLLRQATHIAGTINPQMARELSFTPADRGSPAFEFIRQQLTAFGRYLPQRGIYSMARRNGELVFGPENYPENDPMASPPGTVFKEPSPEDTAVFVTGKPVTVGPVRDEYGVFVSALAPVVDPQSKEVLMVVGIDVVGDNWEAALSPARRGFVVGSAILSVVLLTVVAIGCWRERRKKPDDRPLSPSAGDSEWPRTVPCAGKHTSTGLLVGMGVLAVVFLSVVLLQTWRWTQKRIDSAADQQTRLIVEFDKALRDYVGEHIRPEMAKHVGEDQFLPETMSTSYIAKSVFEEVRDVFPSTVLRFPSTNPRNPANRATPAEERLIRYFERNSEANAWSSVMEFFDAGEKYFVCAVPRRFRAECLQCHGRPEDAPASLVERYGPTAGFGRSVGEVSIDLAAIPVSSSYAQARTQVQQHMLGALCLCLLFLTGIGFLIWADIQRRHNVEEAVEREKRFLRLVIDSMPSFVCVKSRDGRLLIANEAMAKACGAAVRDLEGRMDVDFYRDPEQFERCRRDDAEVIATGKVKTIPEEQILCADGTVRWVASVRVPLIQQDGGCHDLLVLATDVTQRRRAEEELRESLSMLEATLESTADGILVVDSAGKIKNFNRQFKDLWRIPDSVLASKEDDDALNTVLDQLKEPDVFLAKVRELYAHPQRESFDVFDLTDGRIIERYSKPQVLGDRIVGRVWSFRDITEKSLAQRKQEALLHRVAAVNEELTHFAYVVSHDLKAPLRGIQLITDWLSADYKDKLGADANEQLGLLQSRVARMHNLIDGVLQYSRVGRVREDVVPVGLNELIAAIVDGIAPPEHICVVVESGLPVIEGEKTRITQVFQNLIGNAVKFMDKPQGEVRIGCVEDGSFWRFSVSDNGPGIEEKHFDRIFRLFQTLAPRDEFESTGVGLALVKKVVEMYGGRIWVQSQVGEGSTFLFTFPKRKNAVVPEPLAAGAAC